MEISLTDWGTIAGIIIAVIALGTVLFVIGRWVGGINEHRNTVKDTLAEIREDIKSILKRIPPPTVASESPLHLTDFGQDISEQLDARSWARRTAAELRDKVEGKQDFEVQEFCFDYVGTQLKPDQGRQVGRIAYEHGIDREQVLKVLAIELRDALLEIRPPDGPRYNDIPRRLG